MTSTGLLTFVLLIFHMASIGFAVMHYENLRLGVKGDMVMGMLRAMVNQTKGDTLNLPANATSIRANISDTFSCENRTYGYYADVDNECQIFHVCLPSQTPSGRNVTYRWSFICPNETMFDQVLLTCARPRDSIDCEDSEMYYYLNEEMYKMNDTNTQSETGADMPPNSYAEATTADSNRNRRRPLRKQNLVLQNIAAVKQMIKPDDMQFYGGVMELADMNEDVRPVIEDVNEMGRELTRGEREDNQDLADVRLAAERMKRNGRRMKSRGSFRFKADT